MLPILLGSQSEWDWTLHLHKEAGRFLKVCTPSSLFIISFPRPEDTKKHSLCIVFCTTVFFYRKWIIILNRLCRGRTCIVCIMDQIFWNKLSIENYGRLTYFLNINNKMRYFFKLVKYFGELESYILICTFSWLTYLLLYFLIIAPS